MPVLSIDKISKDFRHKPLFSDVTFSIDWSERLGLIGTNLPVKRATRWMLRRLDTALEVVAQHAAASARISDRLHATDMLRISCFVYVSEPARRPRWLSGGEVKRTLINHVSPTGPTALRLIATIRWKFGTS